MGDEFTIINKKVYLLNHTKKRNNNNITTKRFPVHQSSNCNVTIYENKDKREVVVNLYLNLTEEMESNDVTVKNVMRKLVDNKVTELKTINDNYRICFDYDITIGEYSEYNGVCEDDQNTIDRGIRIVDPYINEKINVQKIDENNRLCYSPEKEIYACMPIKLIKKKLGIMNGYDTPSLVLNINRIQIICDSTDDDVTFKQYSYRHNENVTHHHISRIVNDKKREMITVFDSYYHNTDDGSLYIPRVEIPFHTDNVVVNITALMNNFFLVYDKNLLFDIIEDNQNETSEPEVPDGDVKPTPIPPKEDNDDTGDTEPDNSENDTESGDEGEPTNPDDGKTDPTPSPDDAETADTEPEEVIPAPDNSDNENV